MLQSISLKDARVWLPTAKRIPFQVADSRSRWSGMLCLNLAILKSHDPTRLLSIKFLVNDWRFPTELYFERCFLSILRHNTNTVALLCLPPSLWLWVLSKPAKHLHGLEMLQRQNPFKSQLSMTAFPCQDASGSSQCGAQVEAPRTYLNNSEGAGSSASIP